MKSTKRFKWLAVLMAVIMSCSIAFTGCGLFGNDNNDDTTQTEPVEYTIQYTDDAGTHSIKVKDGDPFALEVVPTRTGYDFMGLYDSEVGGTQYVSASGSSLAPFTDKKNMVLFPQWKAKEYTIVFRYDENAEFSGDRSLSVHYGDRLQGLTSNPSLENSVFKGWYTEENCGGTQIADRTGVIPDKAIVNEKNFDLSNPDGFIYLYAGFEMEKHTVTFHFGNGMQPETVEVEYGTPISEVVPKTRNEEGFAVLSWSERENGGQVFNGDITYDMVLYAMEWAPVIELNVNGGDSVPSIVAKAGTSVTLPTPTRTNYKFLYWQNADGEQAQIATMPAESTSLTAVWQAMLVFDENGGTTVNDISQEVGTAVTLPTPEKEGFIFAGWYTADKTKYSATSMPAASVALKAGWYKAKTVKKTFLEEGDESSLISWKTPELKSSYNINFSEEISEVDWTETVTVTLNFCADFKHSKTKDQFVEFPTYATKEHFYFYSQGQVSDAYLIGKCLVDHGKGSVKESYTTTNFSITLPITGGMIYTALGADKDNYYKQYGNIRCASGWMMTNFWVEITYPDTSNLYL